ncbi:MAG: Gfo/Idh/MocA family oxidoreductase [Clostridia bacterium]|nr:Gfo/Idh/MocA family oxidoreductase [Clostridia bacterium]
MGNTFPLGNKELRIGILGMTEGNGHPYSWSAMFNGYTKEYMDLCEFPVIPVYLYKQPPETIGIEGAHITHICCTGYMEREEAEKMARASNIPNVVDKPEDMIGQVDAVICATDRGDEHVERCRPFIEAGLPMFIDKPLVSSEEDLRTFLKWRKAGAKFISSSSMRYCKSIEPYYKNHYELGEMRYIIRPMAKYLETYGIHALENLYPLLGKGFKSVQYLGHDYNSTLYIEHDSGCTCIVTQDKDLCGTGLIAMGNKDSAIISDGDSYYAFKKQLDLFVHWLRTGEEPFPFEQTIELMKILICGLRSRNEGGRRVCLSEINTEDI